MSNNNIIINPPLEKDISGLKLSVAQKIKKMLENGRRYFGSSGASLTHQAFNPSFAEKGIDNKLAKIGLEGERDTTTFLKEWMKDKPNAVLIDSVHIRGWGKEEIDEETGLIEGGDTDHILIIGSEVIIIDTKRWKQKSTYFVNEEGFVTRGNKSFPGSNVHIARSVQLWLKYFIPRDYNHHSIKITAIVCINNDEVKVVRNKFWFTAKFYRLVEIDRLKEFLDEKYNQISDYDKNTIDTTLVSQAVVCAVKPYDIYDRVFDKKSLNNFK